jgi:hypothetical protein
VRKSRQALSASISAATPIAAPTLRRQKKRAPGGDFTTFNLACLLYAIER